MQADFHTIASTIIVVFVFTLITVYLLAKLAPKLGLIAIPGEHRLHKAATPMVGGIAIFSGVIVGLSLLDLSLIHI